MKVILIYQTNIKILRYSQNGRFFFLRDIIQGPVTTRHLKYCFNEAVPSGKCIAEKKKVVHNTKYVNKTTTITRIYDIQI